jgi:hypothetical protein
VARDRGGGFALATQKALPEAIQVADRWHLMENASHALSSSWSSASCMGEENSICSKLIGVDAVALRQPSTRTRSAPSSRQPSAASHPRTKNAADESLSGSWLASLIMSMIVDGHYPFAH